ncbi:MAG: plasmid recombination protein [[Eubacterium] siraeum]|nr:plasmid recombination protein [[Eubacterium] siraeum]
MAAKTISHCQGKGSLSHNNRKFHAKNVDSSRTTDNVTFVQIPIRQAYDDCFGEAVKRYNAKQKRDDRKIRDGYFQYAFSKKPCDTVVIASDKRKSFYEDVVQIGTKDDTGVGTEDAEISKKCLTEYMSGFAERNPNFFVFNAVLHVDEATPHLHIDYIPIAHCKRGIDTQNGLATALKEMGFGEGKDAISRWREQERKALTDICRKHGIEISVPQKARGSFEVEEYKRYKDNIAKFKEQEKTAKMGADKAKKELSELSEQLTQKELSQIDTAPRKIVGGFKGLTPEEAQKLKNTAEKSLKDNTELKKENCQLKKKISDLEHKIEELNRELSPNSPKNMQRHREIAELSNQVRILKKAVGISAENYNEVVQQLKQQGLLQPNSLNLRNR